MADEIKLIIFDLDGTLVNLPVDYEKLKLEFTRILKTNDITPISKKLSNVDKKTRRELFKMWTKLELEALPKIEVIDKGIELYNRFYDKVRCLITYQGREVAESILKKMNLFFDLVVTREDSLSRSEQICRILRKFKVHPKNVLVVGDRESDREAAERLGCKFIFIR